jgi:hypothetical protein
MGGNGMNARSIERAIIASAARDCQTATPVAVDKKAGAFRTRRLVEWVSPACAV